MHKLTSKSHKLFLSKRYILSHKFSLIVNQPWRERLGGMLTSILVSQLSACHYGIIIVPAPVQNGGPNSVTAQLNSSFVPLITIHKSNTAIITVCIGYLHIQISEELISQQLLQCSMYKWCISSSKLKVQAFISLNRISPPASKRAWA